MHTGKLVFAQLMDFLPRNDFDKCVRRYWGNNRTRGFSCRDQFLAMAFAQLTYRESLRDIETWSITLDQYESGRSYRRGDSLWLPLIGLMIRSSSTARTASMISRGSIRVSRSLSVRRPSRT